MAAGRLILPLAEPTLTSLGVPNSGAKLTVYQTGTTNLAALYGNAALTGPELENPQTSNSAGRFYQQSTEIWADDSIAYDCTLVLSDGEAFSYQNVYLQGAPPNLASFAPINSPAFTGVPTAPTPAANDDSSKIATTAYVQSNLTAYAPLASPGFTGAPTAPTAAPGDTSTQIATDAFVSEAITAVAPGFASAWALVQGSNVNGAQTLLSSNNIASVTRTGVGTDAVLFTTPLADNHYVPFIQGQASASGGGSVLIYGVENGSSLENTGFTFTGTNQTGSLFDSNLFMILVFGK